MDQNMDKKIALMIDAENIEAKYLQVILKELREYGIITYKRMYGDFTDGKLKSWNIRAKEYAIVPIQQPRYTYAKNAADIMLVIDAMDILYAGNVDGFCIVSSDSDFTRLVNRLREAGMMVIGMGKSNASKALIAACTGYKYLEKLADADTENEENNQNGLPKGQVIEIDTASKIEEGTPNHDTGSVVELSAAEMDAISSLEEIKNSILEIVQQCENNGERAGLGGIKSKLQKIYSDFDERNYGYNSMTTFIRDMKEFSLEIEKTAVYVKREKQATGREEVEDFIIHIVRKSATDLGRLGQLVHEKFSDFSHKDFGYSQFGRFVGNISNVVIVEQSDSENPKKTVVYKKS